MSGTYADGVRGLFDRLADRMMGADVTERVVIAIASIALALLLGSVVVAAAGYNPIRFSYYLLYGAIGTVSNIAFTLRQSTMLILAGVSVAIAFRAGIFNIGVQGQFVVGGFATTVAILWLAPYAPGGALGGVLLIVFGTLVGILAGGAYAAIPGVMKAYAGANEVITTIMLNFIATGVVLFLITSYLRPSGVSAPITESFPDAVAFPSFVFGSPSFSLIGLAIALATVVGVYVVMTRTHFGYDLRTSGHQPSAAAFSGVDARRTIVSTMTFSGMVAGLTGAVFVVMVLGYYTNPGNFPTFGFDAIAVSLLAANNPLAVVPAGLLFGGLAAGQQFIGLNLDVPPELVDGVVGLVVLFVATPELFRMAGYRLGLGSETQRGTPSRTAEEGTPSGGDDE